MRGLVLIALLAGCTSQPMTPQQQAALIMLGNQISGGGQRTVYAPPPPAPPPLPRQTVCRYNPIMKATYCDTF